MQKEIKEIVRQDIGFNLNGTATYSQVKQIIKISKIVYERATTK